jgi:hypothetical protein
VQANRKCRIVRLGRKWFSDDEPTSGFEISRRNSSAADAARPVLSTRLGNLGCDRPIRRGGDRPVTGTTSSTSDTASAAAVRPATYPRGTDSAEKRFFRMSDWIVIENAVQIAWDYLERSGEISDAAAARRFLTDTVSNMVVGGERRQLMFTNKSIDAYRKHRREKPIELVSR